MRAEEEFLKELDTLEALAIEQYRNAVAHSAVELRIKIENGTRNIQDGKDNVSFFFLEIHLPGILIFSEKSVFFTQVKWPMRLPKGMFLRLVKCTVRVTFHWYLTVKVDILLDIEIHILNKIIKVNSIYYKLKWDKILLISIQLNKCTVRVSYSPFFTALGAVKGSDFET